MIIVKALASGGANELTLECETGEKYTLSIADARRLGFADIDENDFPVEYGDDETILFLSQKLRAVKYAVYLLQFSDKSEAALCRKMREKDYVDDVIEAAIGVLRDSGVISDENLCLKKYLSLATSKLYGPHRIKSELYALGFSGEDIKNAENTAEIDFEEICRERCVKTLSGDKASLDDRKSREKFIAKLSRYGFGYETINTVLRDFKENCCEDY